MQKVLRSRAAVLPGRRTESAFPELSEQYCYPSAIEAEYGALTDKERNQTITEAEILRLKAICNILGDVARLNLPAAIETGQRKPPQAARHSYPASIDAEYRVLIDKKLHRVITEDEAPRLEEIRRLIDSIDRIMLADAIQTRQLNKIEAGLEKLRLEIEALPDL